MSESPLSWYARRPMSDETGRGGDVFDPTDLTHWVESARRGMRRDVVEQCSRQGAGEQFVPPHMLVDEDGNLFCAMFTRPDILEPLAEELGWGTDEGALEYCSLPARVGLDIAHQVVDDERVLALVITAGHETELLLHRHEIGSIAQGRALPLVGYVRAIPLQDFEKTLIAETDEPPPADFVQKVEACLDELGTVASYEVLSTFNADRDLEPHLTLSLKPKSRDIDFEGLTRRLMDAVADVVPPPGYLDIVFDHTPEPTRS
mgnify:CR=1 FL=1